MREFLGTLKDTIQNLKYKVKTSDSLEALESVRDEIARLSIKVEDRIRSTLASKQIIPKINSWKGNETLGISIMNSRAPWSNEPLQTYAVPGMITNEEKRYYQYISQFYRGQGDVIELGPWLGASTRYIAESLKENPNFTGKKVFVFDDFIWRSSWMNDYVSKAEQLPNHADFQSLFEKYSSDILPYLDVHKRKITDCDGNQSVKQLEWKHGPIELIFVDCGRSFEANEAWYGIFRKFFIPNRTIIVMQDWRLHRQVPRQWFNQTRQFTESKGCTLQLIQEVTDGGIATFLYAGKRS